jgi:hypothetical protein
VPPAPRIAASLFSVTTNKYYSGCRKHAAEDEDEVFVREAV